MSPHIFQAYSNAQQYQQLHNNLNQLQQSLNHLGLVILDTEGKVKFITPQAQVWLEIYFVNPTCSFLFPSLLWGWVKHQVTNLTNQENLAKASLPLRIQRADKQLVMRLVIEPERYLLLLEEQTLSLLTSLELLGLSQRETEVLFWVLKGKDNKMIAKKLSIHEGTVRKHLKNIYRKLKVQSRTEAITQALEKLGFL